MSPPSDQLSAAQIRERIETAIASSKALRVVVMDPSGGPMHQYVDGTPNQLIVGRDGRERVVVALPDGGDGTERRVPLDRIVRFEPVGGAPEGRPSSDQLEGIRTNKFLVPAPPAGDPSEDGDPEDP